MEAGRARLRKYVVSENVTQTVPVSHEEIRLEREPIRTSSWETGTVVVTFSVTTYLRRRARPASTCWVPTRSYSSERVMASSVVGPEVSWPTVPWSLVRSVPVVVVFAYDVSVPEPMP